MNKCKVENFVVNQDLCIGCGICSSQCENGALSITTNDYGFYVAKANSEKCNGDGNCINVCPFNPNPNDSLKNENEIANIFLKSSTKKQSKIGRFINTYAGYSSEFRLTSSSGGIATFILSQLLRKNVANIIISVRESRNSENHYEYSIIKSEEELLKSSKTKYFPVTFDTALKEIEKLDGNIAIVGVACFIKAVRLAQIHDPVFNKKIIFSVGIICGGIKSSFFTDYLADRSGVPSDQYSMPEFRIKNINSGASDYSFGCLNKKGDRNLIKMSTVGDMWGTGLFKANACDYCDDVTSELADISLGDAWIKPYSNDGKGTNIIITRSSLAERLITDGIKNKEIHIEDLSFKQVIDSQRGSYNHRQEGLGVRINRSKDLNIPPKRYEKINSSLIFRIVQIVRMRTRRRSLDVWRETRNANGFDKKMKYELLFLRIVTKLNKLHRTYIKGMSN